MGKPEDFVDERDLSFASGSKNAARRCKRITVAATVLLMGIVGWWLLAHREVFATGKTTHQWLGQLRDGDPKQRDAAARALVAIGPRAAPGVAAAMGDSDSQVRRAAVEVSGPVLDQCADLLGVMCCNFPFAFIPDRDAAETGHPLLRDALLGRLTDTDPEVRRTAARLFLKHGDGVGPVIRAQALQVLRDAFYDASPADRRALVEELCRRRYGAIPPDGTEVLWVLADAVRDPDREVRLAAVEALGRSQQFGAILPLLEVVEDKDRAIGLAAERAVLASLSSVGAAYRENPELVDRVSSGLRAALPHWIERLWVRDPNDPRFGTAEQRQAAITALRLAGGPAVVPPLLDALRDHQDQHIREWAAFALEDLASDPSSLMAMKGHLPALIAALDDPIRTIFGAPVATVLGRIGPAASAAVPKLIRHLNSRYAEVRTPTVQALAAIAPESEEVQRVLLRLAEEDPDPRVRAAARATSTRPP
jgi:HEAT repeat protein